MWVIKEPEYMQPFRSSAVPSPVSCPSHFSHTGSSSTCLSVRLSSSSCLAGVVSNSQLFLCWSADQAGSCQGCLTALSPLAESNWGSWSGDEMCDFTCVSPSSQWERGRHTPFSYSKATCCTLTTTVTVPGCER